MRILALEPYYGGSHKAFLDGWSAVSRHSWTLLTLPPHKWKWRMRHSAVTFAKMVRERVTSSEQWDLIFCSDMLNLAEFLGLAPSPARDLPRIVYFHENQLTYPVRFESERDYQFAMTNMTAALAANAVWFNSSFHRDSFLDALGAFLKKMPDCQPTEAIEQIRHKASIHPPGIATITCNPQQSQGPLRILWAARWEHDKNPEDFFAAIEILKQRSIEFRLSVIGEQFRDSPSCFEQARQKSAQYIDRWGFQQSRAQYEHALAQADVFVSTANHEFFGISTAEACLAGAYPLLPNRLAYPEILDLSKEKQMQEHFYDGTATALADKLIALASRKKDNALWPSKPDKIRRLAERFQWDRLAPIMDDAVEGMAR